MADYWGGAWTEIKVEVLSKYLRFYTLALKNKYWWNRIYIDAFAGTGQCEIRDGEGSKIIDGSAKRALDNSPPFQKLIFIEADGKRHKELKELCSHYPEKEIEIFESDANKKIQEICISTNWNNNRAVLFLDPYGMETDWSTIEAIAKTKAIDLWYLFPLSGFYRNLPRQKKAQDQSKIDSLNKLLGTNEWESFYTEQQNFTPDLFLQSEPDMVRENDWKDLSEFVKDRLERIFVAVTHPLILPIKGAPQFALFFAVSNKAAIGPGMRAANWILKHAE